MNDFEAKAPFKSVATQKFKIQKLAQGLSEFVPIIFEDQYFSVLNCHVQSVLLDFRFRMVSFKSLQSEMQQLQERGVIHGNGQIQKQNSMKAGSTSNGKGGTKDD
ncbi:MAG: protein FAM135 [Candidatus Roizmanbacteria bacterium]